MKEDYQAGKDFYTQVINQLNGQIATLNDQITGLLAQIAALNDTYIDTMPPAGSVHAYANLIWPPNNKIVEVTLSGCVRDELSIARDGDGNGVSSAHLMVNGQETIPLTLDANGKFSIVRSFEAKKDAKYMIELYAADTKPAQDGGPNSGLVDQTCITVATDMSGK